MTRDGLEAPGGPAVAGDVVRFDNVHMVFCAGLRRPVWALRGLTLGVPRGAVLGLLGPNGAGKTTAIACLLGLLEPQVGAVSIRTFPCGTLLEDTRLPAFLTVRAALEMVCALRGVTHVGNEVDRVVAATRSQGLLSRMVAALSKGQARRAGLAACGGEILVSRAISHRLGWEQARCRPHERRDEGA